MRMVLWPGLQTHLVSLLLMSILETGNLVLIGKNNSIIWQSFDHPTDSLVPGQKLMAGERLTASVSASNWTEGQLYLSVGADGLSAFAGSNPPQAYYKKPVSGTKKNKEPSYMKFKNGSLALFIALVNPSYAILPSYPKSPPAKSSGHLLFQLHR